MQIPTNNELIAAMNYELESNQEPRIVGDKVLVDIFRGSVFRHNRVKVATLTFDRSAIVSALADDTLGYMVDKAESALAIPLLDREPPAFARQP